MGFGQSKEFYNATILTGLTADILYSIKSISLLHNKVKLCTNKAKECSYKLYKKMDNK